MKTCLRVLGLILPLAILAIAACEKEEQMDLKTIVERHTEARGGAAALEGVNALEVRRRVTEGKRQLSTSYTATRDGRMRFDVFADDGRLVLSQGNDGQTAWQRKGALGEAEEMPEWALAAVKRSLRLNLYSLHELAASGTEITLADSQKVAGLMHWVLDTTDPDGYKRRLFIHPYTYLVSRVQEQGPLNPERETYATDLDTYYTEFRDVDGVLFSFKSETFNESSGEELQKTDATDILVNPDFDPAIFAPPPDDEADAAES